MPKNRYILLFLLFSFQFAIGQENKIWYFGNKGGISFTLPNPTPLQNSVMNANEGCATICDKSGNLLFYSNGITVYNRNHQVMQNGNGLAGHISAIQSTIIVPKPGSTTLFYIFTTDAVENLYANGYNYSIVDMAGDNGNGAVTTKNVLLSASCTERMTAVRAADGTSVWLITNDAYSNIFRSWLIDCGGLQSSPVVSVAGLDLGSDPICGVGMLKVSPDGKQLCQTHTPDDGFLNNYFQLFDFNNATGVISNGRAIDIPGSEELRCEYSPDSKLLYLLRSHQRAIDQVEPNLPTVAAIIASKITISTGAENYYGIQLAPDQKIYLATISSYLAAIRKPNTKGLGCNFVTQQIDIAPGGAYAGLPSFINDLSYDGSNGFNYTILDSCTGKVQFNGFTSIPGATIWDWDFGDGFTATGQNPVHSFSALNDIYLVQVKIRSPSGCASIERSKEIIPKGLILNPGFDFVAKCDSAYVRFINTTEFLPDSARIEYSWDFGDAGISSLTSPIHTYAPGSYNVTLTVKTTTACLDKTVSKPVNIDAVILQAPADREIDVGETVQLVTTGNGTSFSWTPPAGLSSTAIADPFAKPSNTTLYIVTAFNDAGCKVSDSVLIKVRKAPGINVPTGFTPNNDGKNDIFMPMFSDEYILEEFSVYNRWGQKIFTTSQLNTGWNGKINGITQDAGAYVWIVSALNTITKKKEEKKGTFVILR